MATIAEELKAIFAVVREAREQAAAAEREAIADWLESLGDCWGHAIAEQVREGRHLHHETTSPSRTSSET